METEHRPEHSDAGPEARAEGIHSLSLEKAREILRHHVEEKRLRKTPERFAILDRAMRMHGHFSGDDLYTRLEEEGFHVSRSTVYTTLALLCDCGLIRRHLLSARRAGYEVAEQNHCHLVCTRCGRIEEVATADRVLPAGIEAGTFQPSYYSMTVYGICAQCQGREEGESGDGLYKRQTTNLTIKS